MSTAFFKNFGHAIATAAKDLVAFEKEAEAVLVNIQSDKTLVTAVASAISPAAANVADLSYHVLGDVATALKSVDDATAAKGLNVVLDTTTIAAVKQAVSTLEGTLTSKGTPAPAVA